MRAIVVMLALAGATLLVGCAPDPIVGCDPSGDLAPLCGLRNPEDLVVAPGGEWLIASEFRSPLEGEGGGALAAVRTSDGTITRLFGRDATADGGAAMPGVGAADCPGPLRADALMPHGIDLTADGRTLLVVNHGGREAVEIFGLELGDDGPSLSWQGCVPLPGGGMMNDVAALPGGGFVVTDFLPREPGFGTAVDLMLGRPTGEVRRWQPGQGWQAVPGTAAVAPNGVVASKDGTRLFVALWGDSKLARVELDGSGRREIELPMRPDNLSWAPDGSLLVTGQKGSLAGVVACGGIESGSCALPFVVMRVDPETLAAEAVVDHDPATAGGAASVAIEHDGTLWIGTFAGDRLLRRPVPG
jgi:sugar lactone lactonase YvrE